LHPQATGRRAGPARDRRGHGGGRRGRPHPARIPLRGPGPALKYSDALTLNEERPMKKTRASCFALALAGLASVAAAQELPARWDELTAGDWPKAMERSAATCILPIGILEKHGPHAPIGSDLIQAREWAARVTKTE